MCWNTYPATPLSSAVLVSCHLLLLAALWAHRDAPELLPTLASLRPGVRLRHRSDDDDDD
jgi:hypothetical protein